MRQSINLEGVANARELGGFVMADGRRVKHGLILRGGSLTHATDNDIRRLKNDFRLSTIFDFRSEAEVKIAPDRSVPGACHLWLPTIDQATEKIGQLLPDEAYRDLEAFLAVNASKPEVQYAASQMYIGMLLNEYTQLQYASFLQMVRNASGAIYIHCSQGKDRTGLGAAFILSTLGADRRLILEDYDISNECYADDVAILSRKIVENGGGDAELDVVRTFIGANTDCFREALVEVDRRYGSLEEYVRDILMFSDRDAEELRDKYLE